MGDAEAGGADREGISASGGKEEDDAVARSFHETVLLGKLRQAVRWETDREERGCLLLDNQCTKTGRPVIEVLREKHPDMHVPPVEISTCAAFEEYEDIPKTVPLDFTEDDVT